MGRELDAEDIVRLLIESIEQTNESHGLTKERNEKNYQSERKRIQMQLDEKEGSFKEACRASDKNYEAKEKLEDELVKLQEKYEFLWGVLTEGFSEPEFAGIKQKIKEFEKGD